MMYGVGTMLGSKLVNVILPTKRARGHGTPVWPLYETLTIFFVGIVI